MQLLPHLRFNLLFELIIEGISRSFNALYFNCRLSSVMLYRLDCHLLYSFNIPSFTLIHRDLFFLSLCLFLFISDLFVVSNLIMDSSIDAKKSKVMAFASIVISVKNIAA